MAEELTRSLMKLADRGLPRGATDVFAAARTDVAGEARAAGRQLRPAWAAAIAFAGTIAVLGGSFVLGAVVRDPATDVGSPTIVVGLEDTAPGASSAWILIPAIAVAVALVALVVRHQQVGSRKERVMATATETTPSQQLGDTRRSNRWLVVTIVLLAAALVALGAWVVYDSASEPATAASAEISELYEDYLAAYNNQDREAFLRVTDENYVFNSFDQTRGRDAQASTVSLTGIFHVERLGDLMVMSEGSEYFVAAAEQVTVGGVEYVGVSAFSIIETDEGLKVVEHNWAGNL